MASLDISIRDVKDLASTLSSSSQALSSDMRLLAERTGGIDQRLSQIAESSKAQDQKKQVVTEEGAVDELKMTGIDVEKFITACSISGRYSLLAVAVAFLNRRALNLKELFDSA